MRTPYNQLYVEVNKLYAKSFDESDVKGINEWCEYIAEFIKANGWTEDEFNRYMINPALATLN